MAGGVVNQPALIDMPRPQRRTLESVTVSDGGTGASSFTDGGILLGSGTSAITAMSVLADGEMVVGDGTTDPVAESGATLRTSIGVAIGTNVQAHGDVLDDLNTLGAASSDGEFLVATGAGAFAWESGATARTSMGVAALGANLTDIADITQVEGEGIASDGSNYVAVPLTARKNIVINGSMRVAQRSTSEAGLGAAGDNQTINVHDRWQFRIGGSNAARFTHSQETLADSDGPVAEGHRMSMKLDCTTATGGPGAGERMEIRTNIEGQDLQLLGYGHASARTSTVSFWHKITKIGTYAVSIVLDNGIQWIAGNFTQSVTNTWEKATISYVGYTSGAPDNDTSNGLALVFMPYAGSSFTSGSTGSWSATTGNYAGGQNADAFDHTDNNWEITGVQWELGPVATDFEHLSIAQDQAACDRYYQKYLFPTALTYVMTAFCNTTSRAEGAFPLREEMRVVPTLVATAADWQVAVTGSQPDCTAVQVFEGNSVNMGSLRFDTGGGALVAGEAACIRADATGNRALVFDAEIVGAT